MSGGGVVAPTPRLPDSSLEGTEMVNRRRSVAVLIAVLVVVALCATGSAGAVAGADGRPITLLVNPDGVTMIVGPSEVAGLIADGWTQPTAAQEADAVSRMRAANPSFYKDTPVPLTGGGGVAAPSASSPATSSPPTTAPPTTPPPNSDAVTVVALGDSQTIGNTLEAPRSMADSWPNVLASLGNGSVRVTNAGVSGSVLTEAAASHPYGGSMQARLADLLAAHPDVVVIMGGTNDFGWAEVTVQQFKDAVTDMVDRIRAAGARALISTVAPVGANAPASYLDRNADREAVNAWIRATYDTSVIDLYRHVEVDGLLPADKQDRPDGIHISAPVLSWFAEQVFEHVS